MDFYKGCCSESTSSQLSHVCASSTKKNNNNNTSSSSSIISFGNDFDYANNDEGGDGGGGSGRDRAVDVNLNADGATNWHKNRSSASRASQSPSPSLGSTSSSICLARDAVPQQNTSAASTSSWLLLPTVVNLPSTSKSALNVKMSGEELDPGMGFSNRKASIDSIFKYSPLPLPHSTLSPEFSLEFPTSSLSSSSLSPSLSVSSQKATKRKRGSAVSAQHKDPEMGFEPPSAKRQQRLPTLYQSDVDSVVLSPLELVCSDDIEIRSTSSECPSSDFGVTADMPESPNNNNNNNNDDPQKKIHYGNYANNGKAVEEHADDVDDGDVTDDDDQIVSNTTSPSTISTTSTTATSPYDVQLLETYSHSSLSYHGQRTPAPSKTDVPGFTIPLSPATTTKPEVMPYKEIMAGQYNCMTPAEPEPPRQCPLPALSWANAFDVWQAMCKKDEIATLLRSSDMLDRHPSLHGRMRAILLDWLIEVCEVYKLHRETYYLAVDYLDRFLSAQKMVQKTHLQLIGITCLFIAAKVEEIYPPKIGEFAYVTDGACRESDILQHEILVLQALEWNISPVTAMGWLGVYMQLNANNRTPSSLNYGGAKPKELSQNQYATDGAATNDGFIYPQFSGLEFVQTAQLLDLCSLDIGMCNFSYSVIAAAAMSLTLDREIALKCSGMEWPEIRDCVHWMAPFFEVVSNESRHLHLAEYNEQVPSKFGLGHICPNIVTDDSYIIQAHTTSMEMFERALLIQEEYTTALAKISHEASPAIGLKCPEGLLTPPASSRKTVDAEIVEEHDSGNDTDTVDSAGDASGAATSTK